MSPLTLAIFNLAYVALAYPAGALSDRMSPRAILMAGMAVLIAGDLVLAETASFAGLVIGTALWGAHMALTQGIFSRMIADSAPEELRATSFGAFYFVTGIAALLASLGAGWLWDREGASATFLTSAAVAAVALAMLSLLAGGAARLAREVLALLGLVEQQLREAELGLHPLFLALQALDDLAQALRCRPRTSGRRDRPASHSHRPTRHRCRTRAGRCLPRGSSRLR